ncbi:MAG: MBL fold metallo-hydrolase [Chitinispirillaceae bacterium]
MKLTFAGGAGSIGASCLLVESGRSSLIIDCGIRPGERKSPLADLSVLSGKTPEAIIVTHAHTDHSGALPVLAEFFPDVPIIATAPTIDLVRILLRDSLKIMNSNEREGDIPLFNEKHVEQVFENFIPAALNQPRTFDQFTLTFYSAGHILGASLVHIATPEGNLLVTGDYSCTVQRTVPAVCKPELPVDLLVSESTYGERLHEDRAVAETRLIEQIKEILSREGRVLIPSFAVGRAQEIILILRKAMRDGRLDQVPVYVDGMVRSVCNVYSRHEKFVTRSLAHDIRSCRHPFFTDDITPVQSPAQRQKILQEGPCIIIASSGMLNGGASLFYAREILENENDGVLLTGYQDEESPGRALLNLASQQPENRTITLDGETIPVKATVDLFGLSAHADRMEMAGFVESLRSRTVVLVHGSDDARESLKSTLGCRDCISGFDGLVIERSYRKSQLSVKIENHPLPESSDMDRVRTILGPPGHIPVKGSRVAEIWFGARVKPVIIEQFVCRIVELGLVCRDDQKRNLLWVLAPSQSDSLQNEAALADQLKEENPKGRLLEHCMKRRIAYPEVQGGTDGAYHTAHLVLTDGNEVFDSGVHKAAERITAEQLAAKELLRQCVEYELSCMSEVLEISAGDAETLRVANPKGSLIEYTMKHRMPAPQFDLKPVGGEWCCRVEIDSEASALKSSWYKAENKTTAQQAAAREVLEKLPRPESETALDSTARSQKESADTGTEPACCGTDPRITLNTLKQRGYLMDFGYTLLECSGPSHAPLFSVSAWARFSDQSTTVSQPQAGNSKKEAERNAARELVSLLSIPE